MPTGRKLFGPEPGDWAKKRHVPELKREDEIRRKKKKKKSTGDQTNSIPGNVKDYLRRPAIVGAEGAAVAILGRKEGNGFQVGPPPWSKASYVPRWCVARQLGHQVS